MYRIFQGEKSVIATSYSRARVVHPPPSNTNFFSFCFFFYLLFLFPVLAGMLAWILQACRHGSALYVPGQTRTVEDMLWFSCGSLVKPRLLLVPPVAFLIVRIGILSQVAIMQIPQHSEQLGPVASGQLALLFTIALVSA